jgi:hypothetical protein
MRWSSIAHTGIPTRPLSELNCEQFARDANYLIHHGVFGHEFPNSGLIANVLNPEDITEQKTIFLVKNKKNMLQIHHKTPWSDWLQVHSFYVEPDQEDAMKKLVEAVEKAIAKPQ